MKDLHHTHHTHHAWPLLSTFDYSCIDELELFSKEEQTISKFKEWDKEIVTENQHLREENEILKAKLSK